jgi:hypothetical protein
LSTGRGDRVDRVMVDANSCSCSTRHADGELGARETAAAILTS